MFKIIDNVIDKETQNLIEQIVFSDDRKWTYQSPHRVSPARVPTVVPEHKSPAFFFEVVTANRGKLTDPLFEPLLRPIMHLHPKKVLKVRCVLNCQPVEGSKIKINHPHIDASPNYYHVNSYTNGVYYVNNTTGPTTIYKNRYIPGIQQDISFETVEFDEQVEPKKGRLLTFDYDIYHSSSFPSHGSRAIINYNFI